MQLIKGLGLVILAVVAIALVTALIALSPKSGAVTVDYSKFTIRQLKSMARGTGIKSWEKLRKADLIAALSAI
jgi:ABC-type proline/glycine betaine transport system permease subunit